MKKIIKSTIIIFKKQVRQQKYQKKKQYELTNRRTLVGKQNESKKEIKQTERKQNKENSIDEDIDLGRFFELATTNKRYVNGLNLRGSKNEILLDYTGDFELIGSMLIGEIEQKKQISDFKKWMILKVILML